MLCRRIWLRTTLCCSANVMNFLVSKDMSEEVGREPVPPDPRELTLSTGSMLCGAGLSARRSRDPDVLRPRRLIEVLSAALSRP